MTVVTGLLDRVVEQPLGTVLTATAALGNTALTVDWTVDLEDAGGQLTLAGVTYTYTSVDRVASTVTLSSAITSAAAVGDQVDILTLAGERRLEVTAWVALEGDAGPVPFSVDTDVEGRVTITTPRGTAIDVDLDERSVVGRTQVKTAIDLTGATNVPEPTTVAATAPEFSPVPTIIPGPAAAVVDWDLLTTPALYDIHVSPAVAGAAPTAPPDATTLYLEGASPGTFVRNLADRASFIPNDSDTYFAIQAHNAAGYATPSAWVPGRAGVILPGFMQLSVGDLISNAVLTEALKSSKVEVGNFLLDGTHMGVPGVFNIDFTTLLATWNGRGDFERLTARNLRLLPGTDVNKIEAPVYLSNGIVAPAAPTASTTWADASLCRTTSGFLPTFGFWRGLFDNGTTWVTTNSYPGGGTVWSITKSTGVATALATMPTGFIPLGGVVKVGTSWYVLGYDLNRASAWYVKVFNSSWVEQTAGEFPMTLNAASTRAPQLATDGWALYVARADSASGVMSLRGYSTAGSNLGTGTYGTYDTDVTALYVGNADFGAGRVVFVGGTTMRVMNGATRMTAEEWSPANSEEIRGLSYDGTNFRSFGSSGKVWLYAPVVTATSRSITQTFYDSVGTAHETTASTALVYSQPPRQWVLVQGATPANGGLADDPNSVGIYVANKLQGYVTASPWTYLFGAPTTGGAAAPVTNNFPTAPASLNATTGGFYVQGDSTGALGRYLLNTIHTDRGFQEFTGSGTAAPTSTANVTIPGLTGSFTPTATTDVWSITASIDITLTAAGTNIVEVLVDGVVVWGFTTTGAIGHRVTVTKAKSVTGLTAASHTVTMRTRSGGAYTTTITTGQSVMSFERKA